MKRALSILGLVAAFVTVIGFVVLADDGMTTCQAIHSFGVCHAAIH